VNASGPSAAPWDVGGFWNTSGAIDGFEVCFAASTNCDTQIASGKIEIYGIP